MTVYTRLERLSLGGDLMYSALYKSSTTGLAGQERWSEIPNAEGRSPALFSFVRIDDCHTRLPEEVSVRQMWGQTSGDPQKV